MAEQRRRRLRVLTVVTGDPAPRGPESTREAYWARLQSLRAERERLRAG
jgi:hypothetical protein